MHGWVHEDAVPLEHKVDQQQNSWSGVIGAEIEAVAETGISCTGTIGTEGIMCKGIFTLS